MNQPNFKSMLAVLLMLSACGTPPPSDEQDYESIAESNTIKVITRAMDFQLLHEIPSGWNTFRYDNQSDEIHFFVLEKLPDSITIENYRSELLPVFKNAFNLMKVGEVDSAMKEFNNIPPWFHETTVGGGVGMISPRSTAESTFYLRPGRYAMECYIRMPDGQPHTFMGMLAELVVTTDGSQVIPPEADHSIAISSTEGIRLNSTPKAGTHMFKVKFEDQQKYENMLGHDVNLVKLENIDLADTLNTWINATAPMGLVSPAPNGIEFLGGIQDLPGGQTGYFKVTLSGGLYALVSEVPNAIERKMLVIFEVAE